MQFRIVIAMLAISLAAHAQDSVDPSKDDKVNLREAAEYMDQMELRRTNSKLIERIEKPLLTFGDKARDNSQGTVWAWGKTGRPLAILELYQGSDRNPNWANAVTLTSHELVTLKTNVAANWSPDRPQIEPLPIPEAPTPGDKESIRLRQMKELARRFTAHEFWDPNNSRFELRLLVQPVLRYQDDAKKLQDGAAFLLAHGTNPEIVMLIEALGESPTKARWHFSAARLGSAELHLEFDGKTVWKQERTPGVVGKPSDPYWLFMARK